MSPVTLLWVIIASATLQCLVFIGAGILAFMRRSVTWSIFALVFGFMAFRRMLSLWIHTYVTDMTNVSAPPEIVALIISVLLLTGIVVEVDHDRRST